VGEDLEDQDRVEEEGHHHRKSQAEELKVQREEAGAPRPPDVGRCYCQYLVPGGRKKKDEILGLTVKIYGKLFAAPVTNTGHKMCEITK
jgi:hypothetical protein